MSLQDFSTFLNENRDVKLVHGDQRVKARQVEKVLYHNAFIACDRCNERVAIDWVIEGMGLYFVVSFVEECYDLYPREVSVKAFGSLHEMKAYIKEHEQEIFAKLYPLEVEAKEEESDSY